MTDDSHGKRKDWVDPPLPPATGSATAPDWLKVDATARRLYSELYEPGAVTAFDDLSAGLLARNRARDLEVAEQGLGNTSR